MGYNSHDKKAFGTDQEDDSLSNNGGGENLSHGSPRELERTLSENTSGKTLPVAEQISALYRSRVIFAGLMVLIITAAGATSHFMTHQTQQSMLDEQFDDVAERLLDRADLIFDNALETYATMAVAMVGLAGNASWPFYTQGNFETFGHSFLQGSGADLVSWSPIVRGDTDRESWGSYSVPQGGAWIEQGLMWQAVNEGLDRPKGPFEVPDTIYVKDGSGQRSATGNGPFAPVWQMAGTPASPSVVNFDLLSDEVFATSFQGLINKKSQVFSKVIHDASLYYGASAKSKDDEGKTVDGMPQGLLMTPLTRPTALDEDGRDEDVVGVVVAVFSWNTFFHKGLEPGIPKVFVVVEDTGCGDTFTLTVTGSHVHYAGEGDKHDRKYTEMGQASIIAMETTSYMDCGRKTSGYKISVYPSNAFIDAYENNEPALWAVFVTGITLVVAMAFFAYDLYVQKRHFRSVNSAAKLNAIVASLFPEEVRDRLFGKQPEASHKLDISERSRKSRLSNYLSGMSDDGYKSDDLESCDHSMDVSMGEEEAVPNTQVGVDMYQTKPIADLFPNSTIMFADIAGFTAWSSVREPSQVFTLLETVYQSFDAIAKRRKVFKVETVGDCYVAVAGLPEPRADHAVVMAKFARECLDRFNELSKKLEISLGPDTADLAMRAGLHSGPVTAGVLRGDRSRFQLFGDTVNVAARVEGTGMRNRIHMSAETADLLTKAGKEHWCRKRPELVTAKGTTAIQTYWLQSPGEIAQDEPASENIGPKAYNKHIALDAIEDSLPPKVKRLVDWNVEILKKLLQQIVAKRDASGKKRNQDANLSRLEVSYTKKQYLIDEVKEIISLPKFDVRVHSKQVAKAELSTEVVAQLKLYVSAIAALHRENPFHNFEHASHVTMSVSKLLSRIVAPEEIMRQEEEGATLAATLHDHTYGITSDPLTQFACVLSALIHDTDHAGVSNGQLIKERSGLAKTFKEKSIAEQNSITLAWEKLMNPRFAELRRCIYSEPSELDRFRQLIVNNVLATDIFDKELHALRKKRWDMAFKRLEGGDTNVADDVNRKATIVMEHLIQASDVAHTMQHWHIYQKWNERLFAEMMTAFKAGRMDSDPCNNWYNGELGFFDNYIIPLAKKLKECGVFGVSSDEYLNYALENRREWANKGEEVVAQYIKKYRTEEDGKTVS